MIMKKILSIILVAFFGVLVVLTGCKKDEYVPEELQTVTISGTVYADTDLTSAGNEKAPAGMKIIFRIDSRDLVQTPVAGYTYEILQFETTTKDKGVYSINLPTVKFNSVNVDIIPVDFEDQQKTAADTYKDKVFTGSPTSISTSEGERYFVDLIYF